MGIEELLDLGNKIKIHRKKKGYSQKEFAAMLNIPVSTYSNYENNNRNPSLDMVKYIAKALDITVEDLANISPSQMAEFESNELFAQYLGSLGYNFLHINHSDGSRENEEQCLLIIDNPDTEECSKYELSRSDIESAKNLSATVSQYINFKIDEMKSRANPVSR